MQFFIPRWRCPSAAPTQLGSTLLLHLQSFRCSCAGKFECLGRYLFLLTTPFLSEKLQLPPFVSFARPPVHTVILPSPGDLPAVLTSGLVSRLLVGYSPSFSDLPVVVDIYRSRLSSDQAFFSFSRSCLFGTAIVFDLTDLFSRVALIIFLDFHFPDKPPFVTPPVPALSLGHVYTRILQLDSSARCHRQTWQSQRGWDGLSREQRSLFWAWQRKPLLLLRHKEYFHCSLLSFVLLVDSTCLLLLLMKVGYRTSFRTRR